MIEFHKKFADPRLSSTADQKLEKLKQMGSAHAYLTRFVKLSSYLEMTAKKNQSIYERIKTCD